MFALVLLKLSLHNRDLVQSDPAYEATYAAKCPVLFFKIVLDTHESSRHNSYMHPTMQKKLSRDEYVAALFPPHLIK